MRERVLKAREIQNERYKNTNYNYNSELKGNDIEEMSYLSKGAKELLGVYYKSCNLTMRGYGKIIKVARTIADLEGSKVIEEHHIFEALGYRKNVNGDII
ncbi:hypothetical protein JCM1393_25650 [Clostridium carnis]